MRLPLLALALASPALVAVACSSSPATETSSSVTATSAATTGSSSHATGTGAGGTGGSPGTGGTGGDGGSTSDGGPIGGNRPVKVHVPPGYKASVPAPLVLLLHGYSATGALQESYFKLTAESDKRGFLYAHPDGTRDGTHNEFWNATDACCAFGLPVDDSAYLSAVIDDIEARYNVDRKRVFLVGHSNGGFMSHRMACDHADQIAAIASLAGAMWKDTSKCRPSEPVAVLEMHGDADATIPYGGGVIFGIPFPSAPTTVQDWVTFNGCANVPDTTAPNLDLDTNLPGAETSITRFAASCKPGGHAELWTIKGGGHIPALSPAFAPAVIDFLFAHPKP